MEIILINIAYTGKPGDGLFFYSCEHAYALDANLIVITYPGFTPTDYINAAHQKYKINVNIIFDDFTPNNESTFVLGRSMITLPFLNKNLYTPDQLLSLHLLFHTNLIVVYSENHVKEYPLALEYFKPSSIRDLCDFDVYPNGVGDHFEKRIDFSIYRDPIPNLQFDILFLGTNRRYYESIERVINNYPSHGILVYKHDYINKNNNHVFVPVDNLLGLFDTYAYTKDYFDPAPRLIQECRYYRKDIIYLRDRSIKDGGPIYMERELKPPHIEVIL